ncbi:hypothetical protein ACFSSG_16345 [Euzebyella marina]|nr:hypothetical protein [Euzebyella marina]|tara:strand:- start:17607 stop:17750 length:144 start_codon:yes stop_codon:yes gene_type:complete
MEKIYSAEQKGIKQVKASASTVKFLLDYSKSLKFTEAKGIKFESNMN